MFWTFLIGFAIFYIIQTVLAMRQSKDFADTFTSMRRRGRVAIGKKQGLVVSGAFVLFLLDSDGRIVDGQKLSGVTVMSRFRTFDAYDGLDLATLSPENDRRFNKSVRAAVVNARNNYRIIMAGGTAPEPPGPFAGVSMAIRRRLTRKAPVNP